MMRRIASVMLIGTLAAIAGCRKDGTSFIGEAHIIVRFTAFGNTTFSAQVGGETYTAPGQYSVTFDDLGSTEEISGTVNGSGLFIHFSTSTTAGVRSGSIVSVSGPQPTIASCMITYLPASEGPQQFRLQFQTTGTQGIACRSGLG